LGALVAFGLVGLTLRSQPTVPPDSSDIQPSISAATEVEAVVEDLAPIGPEQSPSDVQPSISAATEIEAVVEEAAPVGREQPPNNLDDPRTVPSRPRPVRASSPEAELDPQPTIGGEAKTEERRPTPPEPTEIELMVQARQALRVGEYGAALAALETHKHRFAAGQLRDERDISRVIALCRLGRRADARALVAAVDTQAARAAANSIEGCANPGSLD